MGVLSLLARIGMDTTGLEQGFKTSEKFADRFSSKLRNTVGSTLAGVFGVRAVAGLAKQAMESGHVISQLAEKFNLTTDEVQLLQQEAEKTGVSFESLVKDADQLESTLGRLRGGDVIFSRQQVETLENARQVFQEFKNQVGVTFADLLDEPNAVNLTERQRAFLEQDAAKKRAKAAENVTIDPEVAAKNHMAMMDRALEAEKKAFEIAEKTKFSQLSKDEKMTKLLKERDRLAHDERLIRDDMDEAAEAKAKARLAIVENEAAILELSQKKEKAERLAPISDSLRAVGRFGGENAQSPTISKLTSMDRTLKNIEKNTTRSGDSPFPI